MKHKIIAFLATCALRFWPAIIIGTVLVSALCLKPTIRLFKTISTDPADLLPPRHPNVRTLLKIRGKLEKGVRSYLLFESPDRSANLRFMSDVSEELKRQPFVGETWQKKIGYDFFDKYKLLFLDKEDLASIRDRIDKKIKKEKLLGLYIDFEEEEDPNENFTFEDIESKYRAKYNSDASSPYNESPDGRIFSLGVESVPGDAGIDAASRFHDALVRFVKKYDPKKYHPDMQLHIVGATKVIEYRALLKDLAKVGVISLVLIFIPLLIRFRNPFNVLWMFLPLILGMPISFALTSVFVPQLNVCTSFLFAILGALGIENGIHIFSRYYEGRKNGFTVERCVHEIYDKTGRAIIISVASVAVTFLALVWNDFRGFSEFGLITGIGLWVIFGVYFMFMPALLIGAEKIHLLRFKNDPEPDHEGWFYSKLSQRMILAMGVVFTLVSIAVAGKIGFEFDSKKTRAQIPEVLAAKEKQKEISTRVNSPAALLIDGKEEAEAIKAAVERVKSSDAVFPTIDATQSYYDLFPKEQDEKMSIIAEIGRLLEDKTLKLLSDKERQKIEEFKAAVAQTELMTESAIPKDLTYLFKGKPEVPGEMFFINALPHLELDDGRNAMQFSRDISKLQVGDKVYFPSSDAIVYGKVLETLLRDTPRVMVIAFLLVFFFVYLDFRSLWKSSVVMSSIVFGVLWMLGVMWAWDIKLNFFNMIIIPAVLGMSIDNSIHIFHRYEELGKGSLGKVLATSGQASLLASLTNASAFIGLLFCVHGGLYSIGLLAVIGVATCLLSTLVFFPAILQFVETRSLSRV